MWAGGLRELGARAGGVIVFFSILVWMEIFLYLLFALRFI